MYQEMTIAELKQRRRRRIVLAVVFVLLCALFAGVLDRMREAQREQGAAALRSSILAAATRCCAVEGSYPQSLEYLEDHYGLRVNSRDYVVHYEAFASNVVPNVVVVPR